MNGSSLRAWMPFALAALSGPSCALVLDLDAEGGAGGGGAGGERSSVAGEEDSAPSSSATTVAATATGSTACEGYASFDGQQLILIDSGPALDLDDEITILARVQSPSNAAGADGARYEGFVFSRLDPSLERGYGLVLDEPGDDGAVYPSIRVYTRDGACNCIASSPLPPDIWVTIAAVFAKDKLPDHADLGVWVDGTSVCTVECGGEPLEKFPANPVIGAALDRGSGFLRGAISDLAVRRWKPSSQNAPIGCDAETRFSLSFGTPIQQTFTPDCPAELAVMLGASPAPATDDPQVATCP